MAREQGGRPNLKQLRQEKDACIARRKDRRFKAIYFLVLAFANLFLAPMFIPDPIFVIVLPAVPAFFFVQTFIGYRRQNERIKEIDAEIAAGRRRRRASREVDEWGSDQDSELDEGS